MNNKKKSLVKILLSLSLILSLMFVLLQVSAQTNNQGEVCVSADVCYYGISAQDCSLDGGVLILSIQEFVDQYEKHPCDVTCCCDLAGNNDYYAIGFCLDREGEPKDGVSREYCEQVCLSEEETYTITAQVRHSSGEYAHGDFYLLDNLDSNIVRYQGNFSGGNLVFNNVLGNQYTLRLVSTKYIDTTQFFVCDYSQQINVSNDVNLGTITIPDEDCEPDDETYTPPTDECVSTWEYEFENSENNCGKVLRVVDSNNCDPPTSQPMYSEGQEVQCPSVSHPVDNCDNNVLDPGEQCEIINGESVFVDGATCASIKGNPLYRGELLCQSCYIDYSQCTLCPEDETGCTSSHQCVCEECRDDPICGYIPQCSAEENTLTFESISKLYSSRAGMRLEWFATDYCLEGATIRIFKRKCPSIARDSCNVELNIDNHITDVGAEHRQYDDYFFDRIDDRMYCYRLVLIASNGVRLETEEKCERLPDEICVGRPDGKFCYEDEVVECMRGEYLGVITYCTEEGKRCIHPRNEEPRCESEEVCDACSGPFGVFGFLMYQNRNFELEEGDCVDVESDNVCFREDYSDRLTSFGRFNHCAGVSSCYDYRTEGSCGRDTCSIGTGCEWNALGGGSDLGLGVCVPDDPLEQNCNLCDTNSAFGYCSEEMCDMYGDCYYNSEPDKSDNAYVINKFYCNNKHEVGCETYSTQGECEGGRPLRININYGALGFPISGNNVITTPSNDELNRSVCVWLGSEKCIRDADFTTPIGVEESDCAYYDKECLLDFEPPITNFTINGKELVNEGVYSTRQLYTVAAALRSKSVEFTHYSLSRTYEYPNMHFNQLAYKARDLERNGNSGEYVLAYYSKDRSNNLEEVKRFDIFLLTGLDVGVSHSVAAAFYPDRGRVLSNLTLTASSAQDFTCRTTLNMLGGGFTRQETKVSENKVMTWNYNYLDDGNYNFILECWDEFGQESTQNYMFSIEMDNTISNPSPKGGTFRNSQIRISIDASTEGDCYYVGEGPSSGYRGDFTSRHLGDGTYRHEATISVSEGVHVFRPTCNLEGIGLYPGNNADLIYFGIDRTPPQLIVYDVNKGTPQLPVIYNESGIPEEALELEFACYDEDTNLVYDGVNFYFGCNPTIPYRITHSDVQRPAPGTRITSFITTQQERPVETGYITVGEPKVFLAPDTYSLVTLYLEVSDLGGNTETHSYNLRLRNATYEFPEVYICDPETQICT